MSVSFPTNCLTGWRMHFSWLPVESMFYRSLISSTLFHYVNIMSWFIFSDAEDKQQNPMVQLFYGTFVTERKHEGMSLFMSCCWRRCVWFVFSITHICDSTQVRLCVTLSSLASTHCKSTASTTWMNAWKVPWLRRRSSHYIQITVSRLAVR